MQFLRHDRKWDAILECGVFKFMPFTQNVHKLQAISKNRNGESGNGMRGMMVIGESGWECGEGVGNAGNQGGMWVNRVGMRGIRARMRGTFYLFIYLFIYLIIYLFIY